MNLLFNLQSLAGARTGIGFYTQHLINALAEHPDTTEIAGFIGQHVLKDESLLSWISGEPDALANWSMNDGLGSRFPVAKAVVKKFVRAIPGSYPLRHKYRMWQGSQALKQCGKSGFIYHEPNYIPIDFIGKQVITVHDLSHVRYPEFHPSERVAFMNRYLKLAVERADFIVTDSAFVKDEILEVFPILSERVVVTHLGADKAFHPRSDTETADTLQQFNLSYRGFVLSVGTLEPRKNLERLLSAYSLLPEKIRREYPLVLVGGGGWKDSDLRHQIQQMELRGEVIRTGYLPRDQILDLYASAAVFAYPSIYEGFGLPVLEGFASGTPVLTSNVTSMPEVSGGAALEVDPLSVDEIHNGLFSLLDDAELRYRHMQLGLERSREFSWAKCAEQTMAVYKQLG